MIQRTVIDSRKSAVDQQLATGVGTLGTQYAGVLAAGNRALDTVPNNDQLQRAIIDDDRKRVKEIASAASGGGLLVTVEDPNGKVLSDPRAYQRTRDRNPTCNRGHQGGSRLSVPGSTRRQLILRVQEVDADVMLGLATGTTLKLAEESVTLPTATLPLGKPFRI